MRNPTPLKKVIAVRKLAAVKNKMTVIKRIRTIRVGILLRCVIHVDTPRNRALFFQVFFASSLVVLKLSTASFSKISSGSPRVLTISTRSFCLIGSGISKSFSKRFW